MKPSPSSVDSDVGVPCPSRVPTSWHEVVAILRSDADFLDIPLTWTASDGQFSYRTLQADSHRPVTHQMCTVGLMKGVAIKVAEPAGQHKMDRMRM